MNLDVVIRVGGGLLPHAEHFDAALAAIAEAARSCRLLIVPGGGPFADTVRDVDRQHRLSNSAAHWMAVLAMDQYAHLITSRMPSSVVVDCERGIADALAAILVPVLAPSRWLRAADPLPHSWDVTSDSIAAWVAGALDAKRLVLVKPAEVGDDGVDRCFVTVVPAGLEVDVVAWEGLGLLRFAQDDRPASGRSH